MRFNELDIKSFVCYGVVGITINLFGFIIYLVVTTIGVEPKLAVTCFYLLALIYSYYAHKNFSCQKTNGINKYLSMSLYFIVYAIGYTINMGLLWIFHDHLKYPHEIVQGIAIFVVAGFTFALLRLVVFPIKTEIINSRISGP